MSVVVLNCSYCGNELTRDESLAKKDNAANAYCNRRCFALHKKELGSKELICANCGNNYRIRNSVHKKSKYCSIRCRIEHKHNEDGYIIQYFNRYKKNALKRGYVFEIDFEFFKTLIKSNCAWCLKSPEYKSYLGGAYNGIDRRNNAIGYTIENVVPCCPHCNDMKGSLPLSIFAKQIKLIYENHPELQVMA